MIKMSKKKSKKNKEKVVYYDDNSTISDMSGVGSTFNGMLPNNSQKSNNNTPKVPSRFRDKWNTYWSTVKLMILPMCVVLGILAVLYLIIIVIPTCA